MYTIDWSKQTSKHSWDYNSRDFIVLHHTWHWNINATTTNLADYLAFNSAQVSAHYVVWTSNDKKIYKLADHKYVTWHAWESIWEWKSWINRYGIWIEVMSHDGKTFDDWQRWAVRWLVQQIMKQEAISHDNVIRHLDIAPSRKWDIWDNFWNNEFDTYKDYQDSLEITTWYNYTIQDRKLFSERVRYEDAFINIRSTVWNDIPSEELRKLLHDANNSTRALSAYLKENTA